MDDCNNNNQADADDIRLGTSLDCNHNRVPDSCDLASPSNTSFAFSQNLAAGYRARSVVSTYAAVSGSLSLDFNADGKTDLLAASEGATEIGVGGAVLVYVNTGGQFALRELLDSPSTPQCAIAADFDNDGRPDIATANAYAGTGCIYSPPGHVSTFRNLGQQAGEWAGFAARVDYAVDCEPSGMAAADVDSDGWVDIVIAIEEDDALAVLWNDHTGNFPFYSFLPLDAGGVRPEMVAIADVNLDGRLDLITTAQTGAANESLWVLLRDNNARTFTSWSQHPAVGREAWGVTASDLDGDGDADIVVSNQGGLFGAPATPSSITLFRNNGLTGGTWNGLTSSTILLSNTGPGQRFAVAADMDADGKPDLVLANAREPVTMAGGMGLIKNLGNFTFGSLRTMSDPLANRVVWVAVGDFNGDGKPDVAGASEGVDDDTLVQAPVGRVAIVSQVAALSQDCNNNSVPDECEAYPISFAAPVAYNVAASPQGAMVAQLVGNSATDIALVNKFANQVTVMQNGGSGTFTVLGPFDIDDGSAGAIRPVALATGDWDGDGDTDVATANSDSIFGSQTVSVLVNNGVGSFSLAAPPYAVGTVPSAIVSALLVGNSLPDLAVSNLLSREVYVLKNLGSAAFSTVATITLDGDLSSIGAADLDADGKVDLFTIDQTFEKCSVLHNNGNDTFSRAGDFQLGAEPVAALAADFNHDGLVDVAVCNRASVSNRSGVTLLLNRGNGSGGSWLGFRRGVQLEVEGFIPVAIASGDIDADGDVDLITANYSPRPYETNVTFDCSVLRNRGDGTFLPAIRLNLGGSAEHPSSVAIGNLNGDGRDLVVTLDSQDQTVVLMNDTASIGSDCHGILNSCTNCSAALKGDMNCDGLVNGSDMQSFVRHLIAGPYRCVADFAAPLGSLTAADVPPFVCKLLGLTLNCNPPFSPPPPPITDCNHNSIEDTVDIASGTSHDCNQNSQPDECELVYHDCNANGVPDDCDIDPTDPDGDEAVYPDCNNSTLPDECDLELPFSPSYDCNENGIPDECDIASEYSADTNANGIPDECEAGFMLGRTAGESAESDFDEEAAWLAFYEWQISEYDSLMEMYPADRFQATLEKLDELGLPAAIPWASVRSE